MRYRYRILEREGDGKFTDEPRAYGGAPSPSALRFPHFTMDEAAQAILDNALYPSYCFIVTEVHS